MPDDAVRLPPRPPSIPRRVRLNPLRMVGLVGLLAAVVGGFMLGSAGERTASAELGEALRIEVTRPAYAYQGQQIGIEVSLTADEAMGPIRLRPDDVLERALGGLSATPPLTVGPGGRPEVSLERVPAGDSVRVVFQGSAQWLWRLEGALEVRLGDDRSTELAVDTFVYP